MANDNFMDEASRAADIGRRVRATLDVAGVDRFSFFLTQLVLTCLIEGVTRHDAIAAISEWVGECPIEFNGDSESQLKAEETSTSAGERVLMTEVLKTGDEVLGWAQKAGRSMPRTLHTSTAEWLAGASRLRDAAEECMRSDNYCYCANLTDKCASCYMLSELARTAEIPNLQQKG